MTSPDGQKGWLFGTIHSLPDGVEWRSPILDEVDAANHTLVVEIDDYDGAPQAFIELSTSSGLEGLLTRVPTSERETVAQLIELAGMETHDWSETETWAAALVLANEVRLGSPDNGVDRTLLAAEDGRILNVETARGQLSIFDRLPETEQVDLLVQMARAATSEDRFAVLDAWLSGDVSELERLVESSVLGDPELREALHTSRNLSWMPAIMETIDAGGRPLIAVGAAHMLGNDGLVSLLEAEGYTVTRIQ